VQKCVNRSSFVWGGKWSRWRDGCIRRGLCEGKIERFYLDVGRTYRQFSFSIVPMGTLGINISSYERGKSFPSEKGRENRQRNVTYKMHVALQCGCSVATAD